jgi:hypothetical protein
VPSDRPRPERDRANLEGYRRIDSLPETLRSELRALVGFTEGREAVIAQGGCVTGRWAVLGRSVRQEERLRVQRTWLWDAGTDRPALVLDFAAQHQPLDATLVPGTTVAAELAFYPAALPLRAVVVSRDGEPVAMESIPGAPSVEAALRRFATALAANPWLERAPMAVRGVVPGSEESTWFLVDAEGARLPLVQGPGGLVLLALSGGHSIDVFGEWDRLALTPLGAWAEAAFSGVETPA